MLLPVNLYVLYIRLLVEYGISELFVWHFRKESEFILKVILGIFRLNVVQLTS